MNAKIFIRALVCSTLALPLINNSCYSMNSSTGSIGNNINHINDDSNNINKINSSLVVSHINIEDERNNYEELNELGHNIHGRNNEDSFMSDSVNLSKMLNLVNLKEINANINNTPQNSKDKITTISKTKSGVNPKYGNNALVFIKGQQKNKKLQIQTVNNFEYLQNNSYDNKNLEIIPIRNCDVNDVYEKEEEPKSIVNNSVNNDENNVVVESNANKAPLSLLKQMSEAIELLSNNVVINKENGSTIVSFDVGAQCIDYSIETLKKQNRFDEKYINRLFELCEKLSNAFVYASKVWNILLDNEQCFSSLMHNSELPNKRSNLSNTEHLSQVILTIINSWPTKLQPEDIIDLINTLNDESSDILSQRCSVIIELLQSIFDNVSNNPQYTGDNLVYDLKQLENQRHDLKTTLLVYQALLEMANIGWID